MKGRKKRGAKRQQFFSAGRGKARGQGTAKMPTTIHLSTTFFLFYGFVFFFVCQYCSEVAQLGAGIGAAHVVAPTKTSSTILHLTRHSSLVKQLNIILFKELPL